MTGLLSGLLAMAAIGKAETSGLKSLEPLRWDRRVVLLFAVNGEAAPAISSLRDADSSLQDRDMSWFVVEDGTVVASNHDRPLDPVLGRALTERYAPAPAPLEVLLIGKDGGVKARGPRLELDALLGQVDAMPMRQREMRERSD